jgi:membrane protein required for colicin V production
MPEFEISHIVITTVVLCLLMWRMSYGANNGLFAEATGLVSVFAAVAAVYYLMKIAGAVITERFGEIIPKIGYLVVAFLIYRVMSALAEQLRKVKEIPILGGLDRLLGAILGMIEAIVIIRFITFITGMEILPVFISTMTKIVDFVKSQFQ